MAITMRRDKGRLNRVSRGVAVLCLGAAVLAPARADSWLTQVNARANLLASNNVALTSTENAERDVVLTVTPQLLMTGIGAGYRFEGDLGFDGITYLARADTGGRTACARAWA